MEIEWGRRDLSETREMIAGRGRVDKILNHVSGSIEGVAAIYNRHAYLEERKAALEAWGRHVELLLQPAPSNVVPLVAAR